MAREQKFLSIDQAAEYAGVSGRTIRRRIADGTLRAQRLGPRFIRIRVEDLEAAWRVVPTTVKKPA